MRRALRALAAALGLRRANRPDPTSTPAADRRTDESDLRAYPVVGEPPRPGERHVREVLDEAEDTINATFGLPPVWRCKCGGRPFETEAHCSRCGLPRASGEVRIP